MVDITAIKAHRHIINKAVVVVVGITRIRMIDPAIVITIGVTIRIDVIRTRIDIAIRTIIRLVRAMIHARLMTAIVIGL